MGDNWPRTSKNCWQQCSMRTLNKKNVLRISGFSVVLRFYCQKAPVDVSQALINCIVLTCVAYPVHFFSGSDTVDPVFKIRIQIRVTQNRPEPSGSGSGSYFDMFLKFSKEHFLGLFYTKYKPNIV